MSTAVSIQYRVLEHAVDTEAAFHRLYSASETAFWLDSAPGAPGATRFSYLGDAHGPLAEVLRYRVGSRRVTVTSSDGAIREEHGTVLDYLAETLRTRFLPLPDHFPFDFAGGYVGYLGYEVKADCGASAAHRAPAPDAQWIFADRLVVADHLDDRTYLLALTGPGEPAARTSTQWLTDTAAVLHALPVGAVADPAGDRHLETDPQQHLVRGRTQYLRDIAACRAALHAGESYEITLTDQLILSATAGGLDLYRALRRVNPAPYAAYLRFGDLEIACSSPERFLTVDRTRTVETKPIKGTARRDPDPDTDEQLRGALVADPKTRAENVMIVDLLRNDLGRVCEIGSVRVPALLVTETYATLHQLVSTVRATLGPDRDVIDCVRACFPGGSMTGAPKIRTMEIIDGLETRARGIYSGTIGFLGLGGTADLNIVIRTAVRHNGRWQIGAGGAIVLDSAATAEYDEMLLKADSVLRAFAVGETGRASEPVAVPTGGHTGAEPLRANTQPVAANSATMERWHSSG